MYMILTAVHKPLDIFGKKNPRRSWPDPTITDRFIHISASYVQCRVLQLCSVLSIVLRIRLHQIYVLQNSRVVVIVRPQQQH